MAVNRGEVRAHRDDRYVTPVSIAPCCNIAGPLVVAATVLLDRLEPECIVVSPERGQFGFDFRLDLDRLGLGPPSEQKSVRDPILRVSIIEISGGALLSEEA